MSVFKQAIKCFYQWGFYHNILLFKDLRSVRFILLWNEYFLLYNNKTVKTFTLLQKNIYFKETLFFWNVYYSVKPEKKSHRFIKNIMQHNGFKH